MTATEIAEDLQVKIYMMIKARADEARECERNATKHVDAAYYMGVRVALDDMFERVARIVIPPHETA